MSATVVETLTPCPDWCTSHWASDKPGNLGWHIGSVLVPGVPGAEVQTLVQFHHDGSEAGREVLVDAPPGEVTPAQARLLAAAIAQAADRLEPAGAEALRVLCSAAEAAGLNLGLQPDATMAEIREAAALLGRMLAERRAR